MALTQALRVAKQLGRLCYISAMNRESFYFAYFWTSHATGGREAHA